MARGWESKAVEAQQSDRLSRQGVAPALSAEARARQDRQRAVALSLARVRDELSRATQPAHRTMLERAAAALEAELNAAS